MGLMLVRSRPPGQDPHQLFTLQVFRPTTCIDSAKAVGIVGAVRTKGVYSLDYPSHIHPTVAYVSLPTNIQTAACNQGIKLEKFLYSLFWTNGAWCVPASTSCSLIKASITSLGLGSSRSLFLRLRICLTAIVCSTYTRETAETNYASNGDGVFYCSSSSSSSATHSSTAAALLPSSSSSSAQPTSTLAGTTTASPNPTTSDTPVTTSQQQSSSAVITVTHSSSVVTTFESQTTINGTATTVPIVTTVITAVPSTVTGNGTALGLGATGGEHKSNTAAIAGGVVGGVVGLVLLGALIAWYARTQRKDQGPGGASLSMDTSVASPSSGPTSPHMAERNGSITPFVAGAHSSPNVPHLRPRSHRDFLQRAIRSQPQRHLYQLCHGQESGHRCSTAPHMLRRARPPRARARARARAHVRAEVRARAPGPALAPTRAKPSPPYTGAARARAASASRVAWCTWPRWIHSSQSCRRRTRGGSLVAASGYRLRTRASGTLSDPRYRRRALIVRPLSRLHISRDFSYLDYWLYFIATHNVLTPCYTRCYLFTFAVMVLPVYADCCRADAHFPDTPSSYVVKDQTGSPRALWAFRR